MGQQDAVDERIQRLQIGAIDAQQVIGLSGHRPGRGDFRLAGHQPGEPLGLFGAVTAQMNLHKPLHRQPQPGGVKPGRIPLDIPFCLQPLPPPSGLAGGKVEHLAQFLRGEMGIFLKRCKQLGICWVQHACFFHF